MIGKDMFPKNFLWGAATLAHQVEGGNHNDWTEWEQENAGRLAREAEKRYSHLLSWSMIKDQATDPNNYISGAACDHYRRFEEDFDIAKSLGHNAHRFSIEWSRIEPKEGKFNEKEIEHYRKVIRALRARGMEPFITLWHWTNPLWVRDIGGWENKKTIDYFVRYIEKILRSFENEKILFWMPLNEPAVYVGMGYIQGSFPPNVRSLWRANSVFKNLMSAYRQSYRLIHTILSESIVGISHYAVSMQPYKNYFLNKILVNILDYLRNWRFLDFVNDTNDFIGIQYYHNDIIRLKFSKGRWGPIDTEQPIGRPVTDMGWEIYPEGIYHFLRRAAQYKKPIYITENGIADGKDTRRSAFIRDNLHQISRAMNEGADVRGYFYWSLLDNFEWDKGFWPRFGLVEVNYKTMERKIRQSAWEYKRFIEKI